MTQCMRHVAAVEEGFSARRWSCAVTCGQGRWGNSKAGNEDQRHGVEIVRKAPGLAGPPDRHQFRRGTGSVVISKILDQETYAYGFDAQTGEIRQSGDQGHYRPDQGGFERPLQDAASIAGLLITTEAMVAERPSKDTAAAWPPATRSMGPTSTFEWRCVCTTGTRQGAVRQH